MPHVFRTVKTTTDPETGKRVPVLDRKGRKVYHDKWRFQYLDYQGKRKTATGYTSKAKTKELAIEKETEHALIRKGLRPAPKSADKNASRPFKDVVTEYLEWGRSHGGRGGRPWADWHAYKRRVHLAWWGERLSLDTLGDLDGILPRAEAALRELSEAGRTGRTLMNYRDALCAFAQWCIKRGYLDSDPLKNLTGWDATPKTKRRALTGEEVQKLLSSCRSEYRLLYATAIFSGLRAGELRALKVSDLNRELGGLDLDAAWTKNRKAGFQPLPSALVESLAESARDKAPSDPLLRVPCDTSPTLGKDLELAGIPRDAPGGRLVFHSLRYTFINLVLESGAGVKEAQDLARHSTPDLTMNLYGRSRWERRSELVEGIGQAVLSGLDSENEYITEAEPQAVGMENRYDSRGSSMLPRGIEPLFPD